MTLSKSFRKPYYPRGRYYRLNYNITAPTVRLLDETGKQIGVFSRDEALRRARTLSVDLVEIAPLAKPPVCKIIDFKKFRYLESKKERESKKKIKNVELKQIMLSPFIGEHDLVTKLNRGREFLKLGHRLKILVRFKGRQIDKKEFGFEIINKSTKNLADIGALDRPAHFEGKMLVAQLIPSRKKHDETENKQSHSQTVQANPVRQDAAKASK